MLYVKKDSGLRFTEAAPVSHILSQSGRVFSTTPVGSKIGLLLQHTHLGDGLCLLKLCVIFFKLIYL